MALARRLPKQEARAPWLAIGVAVLASAIGALVLVSRLPKDAPPAPHPFGDGTGTGDVARDLQLANFISSLTDKERRELARALEEHEEATAIANPVPRRLIGADTAPVRITYWVDVLGQGSALLHQAARETHLLFGGEAVALEPRQFPRDGACNPRIQESHDPSVRCLAARALICLEGSPQLLAVTTTLIGDARMKSAPGASHTPTTPRLLSPQRVMDEAAAGMNREALERCMNDPVTSKKLADDVSLAPASDDTKPQVLVNGRRAAPSGPLLRVLGFTGGNTRHPAFASLPVRE